MTAVPEAPASTTSSIVELPTALPYDDDTRTDCFRYFDGSDFQDSQALEGTSWLNQCQRVADTYDVAWEDFALWNGGLGNISTTECAFDPEKRYCGKQYIGDRPLEPTGPSYEFPIRVSSLLSLSPFLHIYIMAV